jgi:hypothetical protein
VQVVRRIARKEGPTVLRPGLAFRYRAVEGAGLVAGALPVVVPGVDVLVAGVELLTAVRSWPHGPNSINAPMITTAAIIAAIGPLVIPLLRLSRPVGLLGVRLLNTARSSGPIWLSRLLIFVLQKLSRKNLSIIELFQQKRRAPGGQHPGRGVVLTATPGVGISLPIRRTQKF